MGRGAPTPLWTGGGGRGWPFFGYLVKISVVFFPNPTYSKFRNGNRGVEVAGIKGMVRAERTFVWTTHPEYGRWARMIARCTNPNHPKFALYGGRGIMVCQEWLNFEQFLEDIAALGKCPPGYSFDRIDNDRGYEPGNVRWASTKEQLANRRPYAPRKKSPSHAKSVVMVAGKEVPHTEAAAMLGIKRQTLQKRLRRFRARNPDAPREVDIERLRHVA